jgi:hypothetical protein
MSIKPAIIIWEESPHFLDHLAPLAIWLDLPLIVASHTDYELVRRYYPEANVHLGEGHEMVLSELLKKYNMLLYSTFNRKALEEEFARWPQAVSKLKTVFVPHGNSDKAGHLPLFAEEEALLIYGDRMRDFIQAPHTRQIVVGNWRSKKRDFQPKIGKPLILFAPSIGGFRPEVLDLLEHYNLLVKLHPRDEKERPGILATLPAHPRLQILENYPPVYPVLEHVDLYLGDISSIGYDFLHFDRPLVFLGEDSLYSHQFGRVATLSTLVQDVKKALQEDPAAYGEARRAGYRYTFAPSPSKQEVLQALRDYYED